MASEQMEQRERAPDEGKAEPGAGAGDRRDVKGWALLVALTIYVVLLGIGTVAEAFDIEWILKWPIY